MAATDLIRTRRTRGLTFLSIAEHDEALEAALYELPRARLAGLPGLLAAAAHHAAAANSCTCCTSSSPRPAKIRSLWRRQKRGLGDTPRCTSGI